MKEQFTEGEIVVQLLHYNPLGKGHDYHALYNGQLIRFDPFVGCAVEPEITGMRGIWGATGCWASYGDLPTFLPDKVWAVGGYVQPDTTIHQMD